jgi:hypothetical protein
MATTVASAKVVLRQVAGALPHDRGHMLIPRSGLLLPPVKFSLNADAALPTITP